MILTVSFEKTTYNELPAKFEAGTPNISGAVGLAAAMDYLEGLGLERVAAHEQHLLELATAELARMPQIELVGTAAHKAAVLSFIMQGVHAHDLGTILDADGVAVRTGHHCAMPVMTFFGVPATARASFACYNTEQDVERLVRALARAREVFG
jgi:cysteine desulfurase/selenocysteine lyase